MFESKLVSTTALSIATSKKAMSDFRQSLTQQSLIFYDGELLKQPGRARQSVDTSPQAMPLTQK